MGAGDASSFETDLTVLLEARLRQSPKKDERMSDDTLRIEDAVNETCPWSGKPIAADSLTLYRGEVVGFCNPGCRDKFEAAIRHFEKALAERDVPLIAKGIE